MLMKIVVGIITGTLIIGGCTFKKAIEIQDREINKLQQYETYLN